VSVEKQVQAQINMLVSQRDHAMNTCVNLAGQIAILEHDIGELKKKIDGLENVPPPEVLPAEPQGIDTPSSM